MKTETQPLEKDKLKKLSVIKVQSPKFTIKAGKKVKSKRSNSKSHQKTASVQKSADKGFFAGGNDALEHLPQWANRAANALPRNVRQLEFLNIAPLKGFFREKPLMLGVVGLGLGAILGTLLPAHGTQLNPRFKK